MGIERKSTKEKLLPYERIWDEGTIYIRQRNFFRAGSPAIEWINHIDRIKKILLIASKDVLCKFYTKLYLVHT